MIGINISESISKQERSKSIRSILMQPNWYDDIERLLDECANGNLDSYECMLQLCKLGYNSQEVIEEIMHDVITIPS